MSVMTRFTRRTLAKNRVRTAVSALGIALSCALLVAVFTSVSTLQNFLLERTITTEGAWQICVNSVSDDAMEAVLADERVTDWVTRDEVGSAAFSEEEAQYMGDFLNVRTMPSAAGTDLVAADSSMNEGRMPAEAGEVSLPNTMKNRALDGTSGVRLAADVDGDGVVSIGDTVELDLVKRLWDNPDTGKTEVVGDQTSRLDEDFFDTSIHPTAEPEYAEPLETVHLEVVGFHYRDFTDGVEGAVVAYGSLPSVAIDLYLSTNLGSYVDIEAFCAEYFGDEGAAIHSGLLRYQGMTDDRAIWDTLFNFGLILAAVIIIASVSLIYNAFAISVSERTRQFGLLSSLGASKRQLRRSVLAEAGMLAVVGIPAGVALGLAGTAVVFALTGEGWAALIGTDSAGELPSISVNPSFIALSVVLSLVTIFVSAWIPALRAGRVSATDAIRQTQDIKLSGRARRAMERSARNARGAAATGPTMRTALFGAPGFIAKRNLSRNGSKGRVAVASLAVSVLLLVTTGSISMFMDKLVGVANETTDVDVQVTLQPDYTAYDEDDLDPSRAALTRDVAMETEKAWEDLAAIPGIDGYAYYLSTGIFANLPANMLVADEMDQIMANEFTTHAYTTQLGDDSMRVLMNVQFVDDALWRKVIEDQGLDANTFCNPTHPVALAVNLVEGAADGRYVTYEPFATTGEATLLSVAKRDGAEFVGLGIFDDGTPAVEYPSSEEGADVIGPQAFDTSGEDRAENLVPLDDVLEDAGTLEIGALLSEPPDLFITSSFPCIYLPMSALDAYIDLSVLSPSAYLGLVAEDSAAAYDTAREYFAEDNYVSAYLYNADESQRQANLMNWTVQVFLWCFTVICALIAVANVFNTVSTSFILRRREFAMLISVGMGGHAFRSMIVRECLSYAVRGLVIGLVLAAGVAYLMYLSLGLSMANLTFTMPWVYVAGACGVVLVILLVSVIYALRKARTASVVEALREDAV